MEIRHLSVTSKAPERSAKILAEMTKGKSEPFRSKNMQGAWVCLWDEENDQLIEFLPERYLMIPTEVGANFKKLDIAQGFNSTHFQIEVDSPLDLIKEIAERYDCHHYFRPKFGGPLYEVWIEDQLLVEFVSDEIRGLEK